MRRGLFGVGGFISNSLLEPLPESTKEAANTGQCVMTFGGNGFFGYAPCTIGDKPLSKAQLRREEPVSRGQMGFWWSSFERGDSDTRSLDLNDMKEKLKERHKNWVDPAIQRITQDPDLELSGTATWVMPKAPTWASDRIALVGDAAHALPSTSGQGISQALLDTQALSLLLAHHLKRAYGGIEGVTEETALRVALQQYVKVRKPLVEKILDTANRMASQKKNQSFFKEMLMYGVLKIICEHLQKQLKILLTPSSYLLFRQLPEAHHRI
jgi:2-polyprenyl-6-methoxyphenol hydroxylase-like FAD-dependent oxidoreductase